VSAPAGGHNDAARPGPPDGGGRPRRRTWLRVLLWVVGVLVVLFVVAQFVPYGRDHTNPPVTNAFVWQSSAAEAIAKHSCYDCHSNETRWWWAVKIAPFSWLAWHDISEGRSHLNFSEWSGQATTAEIADAVNGEMPPPQYVLLHPSARLSDAEKRTLLAGFAASLPANSAGGSPPATATPSASPAADAVAIISARCSSCHSPDQALQFRASSAADANALIDAMVQRGATVTDPERQVLVQYFTQ